MLLMQIYIFFRVLNCYQLMSNFYSTQIYVLETVMRWIWRLSVDPTGHPLHCPYPYLSVTCEFNELSNIDIMFVLYQFSLDVCNSPNTEWNMLYSMHISVITYCLCCTEIKGFELYVLSTHLNLMFLVSKWVELSSFAIMYMLFI